MVDLKVLRDKFFTDTDWAMMEELIRSYTDTLESVDTINASMSNDEIATEVRGRQLARTGLEKFLVESGVLKPRVINQQTTFK